MKHALASFAILGSVGIAHAFAPLAGPSATTFQLNSAHDGTTVFDPAPTRRFVELWRHGTEGPVSYPLVADGRVILAWSGDPGLEYGQHIAALDEATGETLWGPIDISGTYYFAGIAYEAGRVFLVDFDGLLQTFDAATGDLDWSVQLPGQYAFTSSPSVSNGVVYVGGAGSGGTVYAIDASNGAVLWMQSVMNGDSSSPAIADGSVFVSYACPQVYSFEPVHGMQNWHYKGPCEGGGGATPVARDQRLYVRDWVSTPRGYVFDSNTGGVLDRFDADTLPAIGADTGYFLQSGTLRGIGLPALDVHWSFAGDGQLVTAPIMVNDIVFVGSQSGRVYALDAVDGHVRFSLDAGAPINPTGDEGTGMPSSLSAGDGLVLVPTVSGVVAYAEVPDEIFASGFESP